MTIKIPDRARNAFEGNMHTGSSVELPFPAPPFFIVNGDAKLAALKNIQYFGGFACSMTRINEAVDHWETAQLPIPGLQEMSIVVEGSTELEVLAGRSIMIAPIGMRQFSTMKVQGSKKRVAPFTPGARPGLQVLALLGWRDQQSKQQHAWGPILITASGYQVNHVQKSIGGWQKAIKPFVKQLVPDATASVLNLFWMYMGTFGDRKQELVGTEKKVITPITSYIPEDLDQAKVNSMYVGEEVAEFMADISEQADEWLKVFASMQTPVRETPAREDFPEDPPPPDDDIPF